MAGYFTIVGVGDVGDDLPTQKQPVLQTPAGTRAGCTGTDGRTPSSTTAAGRGTRPARPASATSSVTPSQCYEQPLAMIAVKKEPAAAPNKMAMTEPEKDTSSSTNHQSPVGEDGASSKKRLAPDSPSSRESKRPSLPITDQERQEGLQKLKENIGSIPERLRDDPLFLLMATEIDPKCYEECLYPSERLGKKDCHFWEPLLDGHKPNWREDRDFFLELVGWNPRMLPHAHPSLKGDAQVVNRATCWHNDDLFQHASHELRANKEFVFEQLKSYKDIFPYVAQELKNDREFWIGCHRLHWGMKFGCKSFTDAIAECYPFVMEQFGADREVVLVFLELADIDNVFPLVDESLRKDRDFLLDIVRIDNDFCYTIEEGDVLWKDPIFVGTVFQILFKYRKTYYGKLGMPALGQRKSLLRRSLATLVNDFDLLQQVMGYGLHLAYILESIEANKDDMPFLHDRFEELKNHREWILEAIQQGHLRILEFASKKLRADKELVTIAGRRGSWWLLKDAAPEILDCREIMMEAVTQMGELLQFASSALKADPKLVVLAAKQYCGALEYAAPSALADQEIILACLSNDHKALTLTYAGKNLKNDAEFFAKALDVLYRDKKQLPPYPLYNVKRSLGEDLSSRLRSSIAGLTRHAQLLKKLNGKDIKIELPHLEAVRQRAEKMKNKASFESEIQQANDLVSCGPILVFYSKRGTNWKSLPILG